jgi:hypothetical protein
MRFTLKAIFDKPAPPIYFECVHCHFTHSTGVPMKKIAAVFAIILPGYSCIASAAPITALQTTVVEMPAVNIIANNGDTYTQAPGITWNGAGGLFGFTESYGFALNGNWSGTPPYAGVNSATGTMQFNFAQPVSAVGGLLNYSSAFSGPVISIYDSSNNLLESSKISFRTDGTGEFHGFQLADPSISSFRLSGSFVALRNLTILASTPLTPVPEPETYAMLLAGLGVMGAVARCRRPMRREKEKVFRPSNC